MELVWAVWTGGSQPSSHLCFSLSLTAPFRFCSLPSPLFASRFCSVSGQRLIRPNPRQCLARCTGSVMMMATVHCDECVSVRAAGRRWDAAHVIVYLPSTSRWRSPERMCFSTTLPLSVPSSRLSAGSPAAQFRVWTAFQVQNVQHELRGKVMRRRGKQTGT